MFKPIPPQYKRCLDDIVIKIGDLSRNMWNIGGEFCTERDNITIDDNDFLITIKKKIIKSQSSTTKVQLSKEN